MFTAYPLVGTAVRESSEVMPRSRIPPCPARSGPPFARIVNLWNARSHPRGSGDSTTEPVEEVEEGERFPSSVHGNNGRSDEPVSHFLGIDDGHGVRGQRRGLPKAEYHEYRGRDDQESDDYHRGQRRTKRRLGLGFAANGVVGCGHVRSLNSYGAKVYMIGAAMFKLGPRAIRFRLLRVAVLTKF